MPGVGGRQAAPAVPEVSETTAVVMTPGAGNISLRAHGVGLLHRLRSAFQWTSLARNSPSLRRLCDN